VINSAREAGAAAEHAATSKTNKYGCSAVRQLNRPKRLGRFNRRTAGGKTTSE